MLCNKRVNLIIISALIIIIPLVEARREFHNDVVDDENILKNLDDTHSDDDLDDNKCISQTLLHEHEIEDREIMKTSFIPSYCKERQSKKSVGNEDLEIQKWRVRRKRSEDLINFLHLDSMHNLSQEEVRASQARIMKRYMNPNVDPCHDFYNYACGNWAKYNSIPSDKVAYDTFEILREYLDQALYQLLMGDKQEEKKTRQHKEKRNRRSHEKRNAELKAKYLFQSCMNYEVIEKRGIQPLLDLLKSLGGWPLLDPNWNENNFDWLELVANLRKYNNDILIVEYVSADIQNSITNIIQFDQTSLGLPTRDYFLKPVNEKYLNSYRNFMTKIINLMGVDIYEASDFADEIIEFETNLAKIMSSQEDRTNISILYQKKSLNELQAEIPGIDFIRYLSIVQDRVVDGNEKVIMFSKKYMQQLVKLIEKTEPSTVANYILWRFVRHRVNNLDNRFLEAKQKFYQECFGRETSPQRWKTCVGQVNSNVGMAVGALFVRKYFDEKSKLDMITMVKELQLSFHNILNETDWIDESTKKLALKKLESMSLKIGFPDYILNRNKLDEKYASLHISPNKYFENTLNVLKYLNREEQKKVGQSVNKTMWQTTPAVVNAFYSRSRNQIMFPAGILQAPFYHRYFPKSLNYGGIGVVVGHESTHGFDDKGRLFDKDGNLNKWWTDHSIKGFHERTKCLVEQYNKYTLTDIDRKIDGESTQGENIADGGGIHQAFLTYKRWLTNQKDPKVLEYETLPELNLTSTQLFFLNFGQVWCGDIRREANKNKMMSSVQHSPARFRVLGALSNFEEFSKVWNCPLGSTMNPIHKCKIW